MNCTVKAILARFGSKQAAIDYCTDIARGDGRKNPALAEEYWRLVDIIRGDATCE
jgi:hypothetical protein